MERRKLGKTDLELPVISYGASSLGQEFRRISIEEALQSCRVAIDLGMNFIDTSPFYGRGMSEVMLGQVLRDVPRDSYTLGTKLGRYDLQHILSRGYASFECATAIFSLALRSRL